MALLLVLLFLIASVNVVKQVSANIPNEEAMYAVLLERIERLEANDAAYKREIASLQSEMRTMETRFLEKEKGLLSEINTLKSKLSDNGFENNVMDVMNLTQTLSDTPLKGGKTKDTESSKNYADGFKHGPISRSTREKVSTKVREAVEREVAFYATHSQHDVQHLGQNQIIVFDQAVTNIGSAYNPHHGGFVAPVAGTYVFHVTMMGKDVHSVTYNHYHAYIDVDGKKYSELWVMPYEQSSKMFVIELSAGETVTVKNDVLNDGFVGQHMSSFSGFLLYQHYNSVIVGK